MRSCGWGILALICGMTAAVGAQRPSDSSKPKAPLLMVVGCASRANDGSWTLINATEGIESKEIYLSSKELDEARKRRLGANRYKLLGTADFGSKEDLLKTAERAAFTRPEVANATGQLADGRKLAVKGLLITAANEKRLNLVSVIKLADTCN